MYYDAFGTPLAEGQAVTFACSTGTQRLARIKHLDSSKLVLVFGTDGWNGRKYPETQVLPLKNYKSVDNKVLRLFVL